MPTLYDITEDLIALDELLESVDGDITDEAVESAITEWFKELGDNLETKVDNYAQFIIELKARAAVRKAEASRLTARAKVGLNNADSLIKRMKEAFIAMDMKKLETKRFCVSVAKNGGLCPLDIHGDVPKEYTKSTVVVSNDTEKIREVLGSGKELEFATLQERGTRLAIK